MPRYLSRRYLDGCFQFAEPETLKSTFRTRDLCSHLASVPLAISLPLHRTYPIYQEADPLTKLGTARSGASQVWRFVNEIQKGDWVITYSPANRTYLLGKVTSDFQYHPEWVEEGMGIARQVKWNTQEIDRDRLSVATKNTLGSTLTVFQLPEYALEELLQDKKPTIDVITQNPVAMDEDEVVSDPLRDMEMLAFEGIKDRINSLDWDEMQN